ncbi:MAG TPA: YceI family protein [Candidatus Eisenbacteria bacterium]|jgi:polyisoprenoid-binding protein YceI|nr:YceI family protein [Candidatus Eisenbacteria bacterium]
MRRNLFATLLVAGALAVAGAAQAALWTIDTSHSSVGFSVRHIFSKVPGTFDKFSGTIDYDPAKPEAASVKVEIEAASINTKNERRDNHLRSADFFEVEKYPTLSFQSTKVVKGAGNALTVEGNLTMKGVTKPVTLAVTFLGATDPQPGARSGFEATTTVNRKDYGILWNRPLEAGGMLLSDDVTITILIEAMIPEEKKS